MILSGCYHGLTVLLNRKSGSVAQWIRHLTTNQGIVGSNPTGDVLFSCFLNFIPFLRHDAYIRRDVTKK